MARSKRFELLPPRFVVWAAPLKSLRSVTVRRSQQQTLKTYSFSNRPALGSTCPCQKPKLVCGEKDSPRRVAFAWLTRAAVVAIDRHQVVLPCCIEPK